MQSYKDLDIYKISHRLAVEIHHMSLKDLPKFEMFEEGSQIRKSAKGIPSAIVEGFGRKIYQQDFIKFLTYAIASCDETKEHLEILFQTKSLGDANKFEYFIKEYQDLGRKLFRFREKLISDLKAS